MEDDKRLNFDFLKESSKKTNSTYKQVLSETHEKFQLFENSIESLIDENDSAKFVESYQNVKPCMKMFRLMKLKRLVENISENSLPKSPENLRQEVHQVNEALEAEMKRLEGEE